MPGVPCRLKVFEFTLESSVEQMWAGGAYGVATMIVVGSVVWPYVKTFMVLAAWFWQPSARLSFCCNPLSLQQVFQCE